MAGSRDLIDQKKQKDIMRGILLKSTPMAMTMTMDFLKENFNGKETPRYNPDGTYMRDEDGEHIMEVTPANMKKMDISHKVASKLMDKFMPTENRLVVEEIKTVDGKRQAVDIVTSLTSLTGAGE